jgi:hypothetical protein
VPFFFQTVSVPTVAEVVSRQPVRHICEPQNIYEHIAKYASNMNNKSVTKSHLRTDRGERPFSCHVFKKSFSKKSILKNHLYTHSRERPFSCHLCKKSFTQKYDRKRDV